MIRCPVEKDHQIKPCQIVRNVQGKTAIEICLVCLGETGRTKGETNLMTIDENAARQCVAAIVRDLSDRRGLADEWGEIDHLTRQEILAKWLEIVLKAITKAKGTQ